MCKVIVFAGTTEGREIAEFLDRRQIPGHICVATEYGEQLLPESPVLEISHQRLDLEEAIASLKPEEAELIRMKYFDGMTIREIAASLNLPYETVKKRHQRSLHKLRRQQDC